MTRVELLLECLAEECAEVIQRVTKAQRFGLAEIQPGQLFTNEARIEQELSDVATIIQMLLDAGVGLSLRFSETKVIKVERYLELSRQQGRLHDAPSPVSGRPSSA